jgi:cytochrome c553
MKTSIAFALATLACTAGAAPPAPFEDSMAQRTLACTACHGKEGRAGPDGYYPRIAGKPAGYLYNQLVNFRDGRRRYGLMTRLLDPLSDQYLMEIAQHFSVLDAPYSAPSRAQVAPDVMLRGETLAKQGDAAKKIPACVQCHGDALTGAQPATPGLLGLPRDYLNSQLGAWQAGQRRAHEPDCMGQIARGLSPQDLTAVAAWLSSQPVPADAHPVATLPRTPSITCGSAALPGSASR